jgi:hypothetical protein
LRNLGTDRKKGRFMKTLEYQYKFEKKDLQNIIKACLRNGIPKLVIILIVVFNMFVILPGIVIEAMEGEILNNNLFGLCLESLLYFLVMYYLRKKSTLLYESNTAYNWTMTCKLHEDRLEYDMANSFISQLYTDMYCATENKKLFMFYISQSSVVSIPKNIITSEDELQQIRACIKKVPKRKITKNEKNTWVYFAMYVVLFITILMLLRALV